MARIRSQRELRIVAGPREAESRRTDSPGGAATAGARFGTLFERAQQALDSSGRGAGNGGDQPHEQPDADPGQPMAEGDGAAAPAGAGPLHAALAQLAPPPCPHGRTGALMAGPRLAGPRLAGRGTARDGKSDTAAVDTDADDTGALGARVVRQCARATEGALVADHLAERIAGFCGSPALEHAGGRWEVTVELDPAILPATRLHLVLSDGHLSLRFDCRDARARQLICDNADALRSRLEARLGQRIAVNLAVN